MAERATEDTNEKIAGTGPAEAPSAQGKTAEAPKGDEGAETVNPKPVPPEGDGGSAPQGASQSSKAQKVGEQTFFQSENAFISINKIKGGRSGREANKKGKSQAEEPISQPFEDPTEPLLVEPTDIEIEARGQLLAEWTSRRIILLSSFQPEPALAAAYSLVHDSGFTNHDKRTLLLGKSKHRDRSDLTIELFTRPELLERRQQIVLVEIERTSSFLDSILHIGHNHARTVQGLLRQRESLLVCTASDEVLKLAPDQRLPASFPFCYHSVPFLPFLLRLKFSPERASELHRTLLAQLGRGLWDGVADLYEQVETLLNESPERFEEVVRQNEASPEGVSARQYQTVKPAEVFRTDSGVHAVALYTATYFPDLTPYDFERVVLLLLGDQTRTEETEEQILTEQGEVRTLKKPIEKRLVDLWRDTPDRFLRECHLRAKSLGHGTQVIDFSLRYLRRETRVYLESSTPMFLVRMFERLQVSGLLFDPNASSELVDNLIHLFVQRTLSDPSFCSKDWLFGLMIGLQSQTSIEIEGEVAPDERIFLLLASLESEWIRRHVLSRLAQLLREMLQHEQLRDVVREFLATLLLARQHHAALSLLLELTRRLRFAPHFDSLVWLRRLIDQGVPEIRIRTFRCLFGLALESGPRVFELLEALRSWLPAADLEMERYPLSSLSAMRLLLEYAVETITDFDPKHLGQWPSRFPLFATTPEDQGLLRSRLDLLCEWLLHRGMPTVLEAGESDGLGDYIEWKLWFSGPEEAHGALIADLVEQWVLILEGIDSKPPQPEARRVVEELLAALGRRADPAQRKRLVRRWQARQQHCQVGINQLPVGQREERARLLANRKKLHELRQRFLSACPGGASSEESL